MTTVVSAYADGYAETSVYADGTTTVRLGQYGANRAVLLDDGGHRLTVLALDHTPLAERLRFARALAAACAEYVTALETSAAALADGSTSGPADGHPDPAPGREK